MSCCLLSTWYSRQYGRRSEVDQKVALYCSNVRVYAPSNNKFSVASCLQTLSSPSSNRQGNPKHLPQELSRRLHAHWTHRCSTLFDPRILPSSSHRALRIEALDLCDRPQKHHSP